MVLWGIERYFDEHLWLGEDGHLGSLLVQWAGGILAVAGIVLLVTRFGPLQKWRHGGDGEAGDDMEAGRGDMPDSGHENEAADEGGSRESDRTDGPDGPDGPDARQPRRGHSSGGLSPSPRRHRPQLTVAGEPPP